MVVATTFSSERAWVWTTKPFSPAAWLVYAAFAMSTVEQHLQANAARGAGRSRHIMKQRRARRWLLPPLLLLAARCASAQHRGELDLARDVQLVIAATELRPELWEAQQATFLRAFGPAVRMTESNSSCTLCTSRKSKGLWHQELFLSDRREGEPSIRMSNGWWCAASRPLQALRLAVETTSPRWLVAIDDDTYVNPPALQRLLEAHDAELPMVFGSRVAGGAGFIISAGAAQRLLAPTQQRRMEWNGSAWRRADDAPVTVLDACIQAQLGGSMCAAHADWAMGRCLYTARVPLVERRITMQQNCDYPRKRKTCDDAMLTCHHVSAEEMLALHALCNPPPVPGAAG